MLLITAHEGCEGSAGNCITAVQTGIDAEADIIEVDVRSTKDKIAILSHSSIIETICGKKLSICDITFDDLLKMERENQIILNHRDSKITRLEEVFDLIRGENKILNLDAKEDESIEPLAKSVLKANMLDYVVISGCERLRASYLKKNYPQFQVLYNVDKSLYGLNDLDHTRTIKTIYQYAVQAGCCGINTPYRACTPELVDFAHQRFLPVSVWTVDDNTEMQKYIDMGVYSITTKKPKILRSIINSN